ncbi:MAG: GntR family transcriptional regulator [Candidatus Eremiobacteraeota bacterium]|nr:GntR family transcriptional regulator [Candidatus Eremiobacteraeota bacterium]
MTVQAPPFVEEDIYRIVKETILSAQLPPGTRLLEARLAPVFGVTRERLRKVLRRLGHENMLDIIPNIGTVVPTPSLEKARELFEARRALESGICMRLCDRITEKELQQIREHLAQERKLADGSERAEFILASSSFHVLLASFLRNDLISGQLDALLSKSALFSTFHDPRNVSMCACQEHQLIADALAKRDSQAAYHACVSHLSLIETRLQAAPTDRASVDITAVFGERIARSLRRTAPKSSSSRRSVERAA